MYVMSYFWDEDPNMFLAKSEDLFTWDLWEPYGAGLPVLKADTGYIIRDPFIIHGKDDQYHAFFTDNWHSHTIGHSTSRDLVRWSDIIHIPVMKQEEDIQNCWAPECFIDESTGEYQLIWSTSFISQNDKVRESNRIWGARSKDLEQFQDPQLFFDPGYTVIDATVLPMDGIYYMAFKDERGTKSPDTDYKALRVCTSQSAKGPFQNISDLLTHNRCEGPSLVYRDHTFYMFYDSFGDHTYRGAISTDFYHWTEITEKLTLPQRCKHFSILTV